MFYFLLKNDFLMLHNKFLESDADFIIVSKPQDPVFMWRQYNAAVLISDLRLRIVEGGGKG